MTDIREPEGDIAVVVVKRFWARVQKSEGCWTWTGTFRGKYGSLRDADGIKEMPAHRVSYRLNVGPIPDGLVLDHLCRNTRCVNPAHLEPVTDRVNILRGTAPAAINAAKTECIRGHSLSGANLIVNKSGKRNCRECTNWIASKTRARRRLRLTGSEESSKARPWCGKWVPDVGTRRHICNQPKGHDGLHQSKGGATW